MEKYDPNILGIDNTYIETEINNQSLIGKKVLLVDIKGVIVSNPQFIDRLTCCVVIQLDESNRLKRAHIEDLIII